MRFYFSKTNRFPEGMLYLFFTDGEAEHLGPKGTRMGVHPGPDQGQFVVKPDVNSRARLHPTTRDIAFDHGWVVSFAANIPSGWPESGRTCLVHSQLPEGFLVRPHESELKDVRARLEKGPRQRKGVNREPLPLNLPGPYAGKASKELMNRSMVGAPATIQDLKDALEIINDVLVRLPKEFEVQPYIEDGRVRASVITKVEL